MEFSLLADDRRLAWRTLGDGPPLVLLHGWAMSSAVFAEVMPQLAESHRVLALDLPGHGLSDSPAIYTLNGLADDVAAWLVAVGIDRCALLGWSLGGQIAMQLTADRPQLAARLLLISSTPCFTATEGWAGGLPGGQVRAMERQLRRSYELAMSDFFARMFEGEDVPRERYREIIRFAVRSGQLPAAADVLGCLDILRNADLRSMLPVLDRPTLVHYGGKDSITPALAGDYLAMTIPGARGVCWDGIGHAPFLSRPVASVSLWQEFLQT